MPARKVIADNCPIEYVTRRAHEGIPAGSKVVALREEKGSKLVFLYEGKRHEIPGGDFYLVDHEEPSWATEFMLAY